MLGCKKIMAQDKLITKHQLIVLSHILSSFEEFSHSKVFGNKLYCICIFVKEKIASVYYTFNHKRKYLQKNLEEVIFLSIRLWGILTTHEFHMGNPVVKK